MRKEEAWSGDGFPSSGRGFQGYGSCKSSGALDSQVIFVHVRAQSCPTPCHSMGCSPPGSSVHGILQARKLEWVAIRFFRDVRDPEMEPRSSALQADSLLPEIPGKSYLFYAAAKSLQSCLTLCDPIDSSPPGSAVPGILKARTLEWIAISFSSA